MGAKCFGGEVEATAGRDWTQNGNGKVATETGGAFFSAASLWRPPIIGGAKAWRSNWVRWR